ncbi:hypothetical protein [Streptomyces sp. NPDC026659]|uniref:hypothetical protein n=1 Tax=Streptomyces sp. NPDC026659 TaxID=3155123 RepID=UPI0033D1A821
MRGVSLVVAVVAACCAVGGWGASAGAAEASGPSDSSPAPRATAYPGELRCYATRRDPGTVRCYRLSAKAEFRHGEIVYVPILVQVPVPPRPPSVTVVGSLNDIRPGAAGASAPGG